MLFTPNFRLLAGAVAGASVALGGLVSPAIAQDRTAWLYDNQTTSMTGYFLAGEDIYAVCDEDCLDIDLFLYDETGTLVDADEALDSYPIVTAPYEGNFTLQVNMPNCTHTSGCAVSISSDYGF
jgi:hypothetical protein